MLFTNIGRLQYSISDIPNFLRARALAAKADASIDPSKFQDVIARHSSEGYDSYKYFDKQLWLRSKMMRAIELGLDKSAQSSVLDMGCGSGILAIAAAKRFPRAKVLAVDGQWESMLQPARRRRMSP